MSNQVKITRWPKVVMAWMTPALVGFVFMGFYYNKERMGHADRIARAEQWQNHITAEHTLFKEKMTEIITKSGYKPGGWDTYTQYLPDPYTGRKVNVISEEKTPVMSKFESMQELILNGHDEYSARAYAAVRRNMQVFKDDLNRNLAHRVTEYVYRLPELIDPRGGKAISEFVTVQPDMMSSDSGSSGAEGESSLDSDPLEGEGAAEGSGEGENVENSSSSSNAMADAATAISTDALNRVVAALSRASEGVSVDVLDRALAALQANPGAVKDALARTPNLTLQRIMLLQQQLIASAARGTEMQATVVLMTGGADIGAKRALSRMNTSFDENLVANLKNTNDATTTLAGELTAKTDAGAVRWGQIAQGDASVESGESLSYVVNRARDEMTALGNAVVLQQQAFRRTAAAYRDLLNEVKPMGTKNPLSSAYDVVGRIESVNNESKTAYIDLGSAHDIHPGMRFEVWRVSGKDSDYLKGVVEVVRVLSSSYSQCVILDTSSDKYVVEEGDALIHLFWKDGKYLRVALHGQKWGPPDTKHDKFRLRAMLEELGVPVDNVAGAGTRVVILGAEAAKDADYWPIRKIYDFETFQEERIRLYVDPR